MTTDPKVENPMWFLRSEKDGLTEDFVEGYSQAVFQIRLLLSSLESEQPTGKIRAYTSVMLKELYDSRDKQKQLLVEIMNADAKDGLYNQMTSVEWLYNLSKTRELDLFDLEKAEKMRKKEIIAAANLTKEQRWYDDKLYNNCGEQYYSKTYNKFYVND